MTLFCYVIVCYHTRTPDANKGEVGGSVLETNLYGLMAFVILPGLKSHLKHVKMKIATQKILGPTSKHRASRRPKLVSASTCAAPRLASYIQKHYSAGREQATTNRYSLDLMGVCR